MPILKFVCKTRAYQRVPGWTENNKIGSYTKAYSATSQITIVKILYYRPQYCKSSPKNAWHNYPFFGLLWDDCTCELILFVTIITICFLSECVLPV